MAKVVVLLSPSQRARLLDIPETFTEREITRYYALSADDLAVIEQHRRPQNRLGHTVQLAYLRFPGRPWDPEERVTPAILSYLAQQIGEAPEALAEYATRDPTRREHPAQIQRTFGFRPFTQQIYRELSRWLLPIALSTDQGIVLADAVINPWMPGGNDSPASCAQPTGATASRTATSKRITASASRCPHSRLLRSMRSVFCSAP
jgi:hypothetical protein